MRHGVAADPDRVAGALLLLLLDEADAGCGNRMAHLLRLMTHHGGKCVPA